MLVQVEAAIWPAGPARCANHQTQHAVAPTAHPVLVGLRQEIVDGVDPLRINLAQGRLGEVIARVEECESLGALAFGGGCPAELLLVVAVQRRATTGVARVEEEILHVDRDKLLRAADLVDVRAAGDLAIVLFALATPANVLLPTGEVKQARVVAEGEAAAGLAPALVRNAHQPRAALLAGAALNQCALRIRPQACAVINVGQLVQYRGE
ncbi:hypothetical protein D3C76_686850 [compost metagenome]